MKKKEAMRASGRERTRRCRQKKKESTFPRVEYTEIKAIPPPTRAPEGLIFLRAMNEYMRENLGLVEKEFERYAPLADSSIPMTGIRLIHGDRYKVLVTETAGQGTGIIDWLLGEVEKAQTDVTTAIPRAKIELIRKSIIVFANAMALKDERVSVATVFQNHALIVSFGKCQQQDVHIDLDKKGHFQFAMLCTDQVLGTKEYTPQRPLLGARCNLRDVWSDVPTPLANFLQKQPETKALLHGFGRLLSVSADNTDVDESPPLPLGTLLSLPGEVVHAGPGAESLRAVMFFTGTPTGEAPYTSEIQHTRTTLIGEIIMYSWIPLQQKPDYAKNRSYLLRKWIEIGLDKDNFALNSMHHVHLIKLATAIMNTKDKIGKENLVQALASQIWQEDDWGDPNYKYKLPKIAGERRKLLVVTGKQTSGVKRKAGNLT